MGPSIITVSLLYSANKTIATKCYQCNTSHHIAFVSMLKCGWLLDQVGIRILGPCMHDAWEAVKLELISHNGKLTPRSYSLFLESRHEFTQNFRFALSKCHNIASTATHFLFLEEKREPQHLRIRPCIKSYLVDFRVAESNSKSFFLQLLYPFPLSRH